MDSAPSSSPPPADQDFDALFSQAKPINVSECEDTEDETADNEEPNRFHTIADGFNKNTQAELRELQRLMMDVARCDEMGSAKASAARAWKELEILRLAKLGKPLMLNVTGKADVQRRTKPTAPTIVLDPSADSSQAA